MIDDTLEQTADKLSENFLRPPSAQTAIKMILMTKRLHLSAISGLFRNTVHCQETLDAAYNTSKEAGEDLETNINEILAIIGEGHNLKVKGEPTSHNEQVTKEILAGIAAEKR